MRLAFSGLLFSSLLAGCAAGPAVAPSPGSPADAAKAAPAGDKAVAQVAAPTPDAPALSPGAEEPRAHSGPWIGAAGASDFVVPGTQDTQLGVWIDVPAALKRARVPAAVSIVVDVSGSMGGDKIVHARGAARSFINGLSDGDLVSLIAFSDSAREIISSTALNASTRQMVLAAVEGLQPEGGTNMFEGLRLGEGRALTAPASHSVRRIVLISDGKANVGPSSADVLGALAQRGAERGVQITSVGVGVDYDESTLNALAINSSGRLYHLSEPREMPAILEKELALLQGTAATEAFVEIVPAPGVQLLGVNGARTRWASDGALRVDLGTMFAGQHREMLVRARLTAPSDGKHALASVRLHFRDPGDGNLERVQEVVARYEVTPDAQRVAASQNARTMTIAAMMDAGQATVEAAQQVNAGDFDAADKKLAQAEEKLKATAAQSRSKDEQQRAIAAAATVSKQRAAARGAAAKPAPARRNDVLEMNQAGMKSMGF